LPRERRKSRKSLQGEKAAFRRQKEKHNGIKGLTEKGGGKPHSAEGGLVLGRKRAAKREGTTDGEGKEKLTKLLKKEAAKGKKRVQSSPEGGKVKPTWEDAFAKMDRARQRGKEKKGRANHVLTQGRRRKEKDRVHL